MSNFTKSTILFAFGLSYYLLEKYLMQAPLKYKSPVGDFSPKRVNCAEINYLYFDPNKIINCVECIS